MLRDRARAADVTQEDIVDLIDRGEPEAVDLEYKREPPPDLQRLIDRIAGMAQARGGFVVIGIDEDDEGRARAIVDVNNARGVADAIRARIYNYIEPPLTTEVVLLRVRDKVIIVIRVEPSDGPYMVTYGDATDFFKRVDTDNRKMSFTEIEAAFAARLRRVRRPEEPEASALVRTVQGLKYLHKSTDDAFKVYLDEILAMDERILAIVAISESPAVQVDAKIATALLRKPEYYRAGGWVVAQPEWDVSTVDGIWVQGVKDFYLTTVSSNGDVVFEKPFDEALCWRQDPKSYEQSPRIYPNALVEYFLSYCALVDSLARRIHPRRIWLQTALNHAAGTYLPKGVAGSFAFESPIDAPRPATEDQFVGRPVVMETRDDGSPSTSYRTLAYQLLRQVYAFYGHAERDIPFSDHERIVFNERRYPDWMSDSEARTLTTAIAMHTVRERKLARPSLNVVGIGEDAEDAAAGTLTIIFGNDDRQYKVKVRRTDLASFNYLGISERLTEEITKRQDNLES